MKQKQSHSTTANADEIAQFQKDSSAWWDEQGPFAPLHALNPVRMEFMVGVLDQCLTSPSAYAGGLVGIERGPRVKPEGPEATMCRHLDVGCGGGLVCEPFARLGANVVGLDADPQAIQVAKRHAQAMGLAIDYQATTIEDFNGFCHPGRSTKGAKTRDDTAGLFDTATALEVIEHVDHPEFFLKELAGRVRPGGIIFLSTLNRTLKSLALGKVVAEYVLGWVPAGTHDWRKFVKPSELAQMMAEVGCVPVAATGLCYHPIKQEFYLDAHDLDINYMMAFRKG